MTCVRHRRRMEEWAGCVLVKIGVCSARAYGRVLCLSCLRPGRGCSQLVRRVLCCQRGLRNRARMCLAQRVAEGACKTMQSFVGTSVGDRQRLAEECKAPWLKHVGLAGSCACQSFMWAGLVMIAPRAAITRSCARRVGPRVCVVVPCVVAWGAPGWSDDGGGFCKA